MGVSHPSGGSSKRVGIPWLPPHHVCLSIDTRQRCNGPACVRLRIRNSHHDGRQHNNQVCAARIRASIRPAMGEQSGVPSLHRAGHRPHPSHPLHCFRLFDGEDLHAAVVCIPTDVLHDQVNSLDISSQLIFLSLTCFNFSFRNFKKALNDVILSRRAIHNMNTLYPDATSEELTLSDNICIICRFVGWSSVLEWFS